MKATVYKSSLYNYSAYITVYTVYIKDYCVIQGYYQAFIALWENNSLEILSMRRKIHNYSKLQLVSHFQ